MLRAGIVGLPNVGKSTLFNALTQSVNAQSANYPFCTIEPNVGVVTVPDERLYILKDLVKTQTVIPSKTARWLHKEEQVRCRIPEGQFHPLQRFLHVLQGPYSSCTSIPLAEVRWYKN